MALTIRDTGIGISVENMTKLFQAFSQIDSSPARKFEGTGLGLAMVKRLAEIHGGTVAVASAERSCQEKSRRAGCDGYITKPLRYAELHAAIDGLLPVHSPLSVARQRARDVKSGRRLPGPDSSRGR